MCYCHMQALSKGHQSFEAFPLWKHVTNGGDERQKHCVRCVENHKKSWAAKNAKANVNHIRKIINLLNALKAPYCYLQWKVSRFKENMFKQNLLKISRVDCLIWLIMHLLLAQHTYLSLGGRKNDEISRKKDNKKQVQARYRHT